MLGLGVRAATMMAVYQHSLGLTASARLGTTVGSTTNLMAIDAEKLFLTTQFIHFLWHGPLAFLMSLVVLFIELGPSALAGFALLAALIFMQKRISKRIGANRRRMAKATDKRISVMSEVLQGIRAIKLLAWEVPMRDKVAALREVEMQCVWDYLILNGLLREMMFMAGPLMGIVMFTTYAFAAGEPLTTAKVFRCLAFINILRFPLNLLSQVTRDGLVLLKLFTFYKK